MKKTTTVGEYIKKSTQWRSELTILRSIIISTGLMETVKWSAPVYTHNGKNIVGLGAFKHHVGVWFFQGALLKDPYNLLINAQENVTKALRQWRITSLDEIDETKLKQYLFKAIENNNKGLMIKKSKRKELELPIELQNLFLKNSKVKENFNKLTPYKQREYIEYITEAQKETTKQNRLTKITPLLLQGKGLHDKYR